MDRVEYLKTLPSYLKGSLLQTLATMDRPIGFVPRPPRPVVLVPGAFCTSSVMNRLGEQLEVRGRSVALTPDFPYYFSALANLCRIDRAVDLFIEWLGRLRRDRGIAEVDVAAHSNGGLIALLALARQDQGLANPGGVEVRRVVTMATPFGGFPGARVLSLLLPCCRDLVAGASVLDRARLAEARVIRCLVSAADSLIPPERQSLDPDRRTIMPGFQHMDFIVGSTDRIARTADEVVRWLDSDC